MLRAGDILEGIPGVLISQHSGEGKANQYYLRGFNLDHGTDFATSIAGVPVNMPTHAHGQGYTDLNFIIPELVSGVQYRKGTYSAEDGDFSSAGSARFSYWNTLPNPIASLTAGEGKYFRLLLGLSPRIRSGNLLGGLELIGNDGPWVNPDEYRKVNGIVRYSRGTPEHGFSVTAMGYHGTWNATDQIPQRAVTSGFPRFGAIDPTDGGTSYRYSLSTEFQDLKPGSLTKASAYVIKYDLDLFSNFTYFLSDTLQGDQIEQSDERVVTGFRFSHETGDPKLKQTIGCDIRNDNIAEVGIYHTEARRRLSAIRADHVSELSLSPFLQSDIQLNSRLRTLLGIRADGYRFNVASSYPPYSGGDVAGIVSPKVSVIVGPWGPLNLYANGGFGFHSHDARGARFNAPEQTQARQAKSGSTEPQHFPVPGGPAIALSPLLVRTKGAEIGARFSPRTWSATASIWGLDIDSETVFLGDAGLTAPSRPSRRTGIELTFECRPEEWLRLETAFAYSRARFLDVDPAGNYIPGAVEGVASASVAYQNSSGTFGELRVRYFGPRPLIEDNSVRSDASTILNTEFGYRAHKNWSVALQIFNLLDRKVSDVDYYYRSRLPGEPAEGIADVHSHPQEPRSFRLVLSIGLSSRG